MHGGAEIVAAVGQRFGKAALNRQFAITTMLFTSRLAYTSGSRTSCSCSRRFSLPAEGARTNINSCAGRWTDMESGSQGEDERPIGSHSQNEVTIDQLDKRILASLLIEGRISFRQMAQEFHTSTSTVSSRVSKLEKSGVITGYSVTVNFEALGYDLTAVTEFGSQKGSCPNREGDRKTPRRVRGLRCDRRKRRDIVAKFRKREELSRFAKGLLSMPFVERANTHIVLGHIQRGLPRSPVVCEFLFWNESFLLVVSGNAVHRPPYHLERRVGHSKHGRNNHNCGESFQPELIERGQTTSEEQPARQAAVSRGSGERTLREEGDHHETEDSADQVRRKQRYGIGEPFAPWTATSPPPGTEVLRLCQG